MTFSKLKFTCLLTCIMLLSLDSALNGQTLGELLTSARSGYENANTGRLEIVVSDDGSLSFSESYLYERENDQLRITSTSDENLLLVDDTHFVIISPVDSLVTYGPSEYVGASSDPMAMLPSDLSEEISLTVGTLENGQLVFKILLVDEQSAELRFDASTQRWISSILNQNYFDAFGKEHIRKSKYTWTELHPRKGGGEVSTPCSIVDFAAIPPIISDPRFLRFRVSGPGQ